VGPRQLCQQRCHFLFGRAVGREELPDPRQVLAREAALPGIVRARCCARLSPNPAGKTSERMAGRLTAIDLDASAPYVCARSATGAS
jgi:hypothetical protein